MTEAKEPTQIVQMSGELQAAEEETRASLARRHPRKLVKVMAGVMDEIHADPSAAGRMFYSIPYKDGKGAIKPVEGLSIKAATMLLRYFGNASAISRVTDEAEEHVDILGVCHDHQTNTTVGRTIRCSRWSKVRGSMTRLAEDRYALKIAATASKAVRNAILDVIPEFIKGQLEEAVKDLAAGPTKTSETAEERAQRFASAFRDIGVGADALAIFLGKPLVEMEREDARRLSGALTAIKEGFAAADTIFPSSGETSGNGGQVEAELPSDAETDEEDVILPKARAKPRGRKGTPSDPDPEPPEDPEPEPQEPLLDGRERDEPDPEPEPTPGTRKVYTAADAPDPQEPAPVPTQAQREESTVADLLAALEEVTTSKEFFAWPNNHAQAIINLTPENREAVLANWEARGKVKKFNRKGGKP